MQDYCYVIRSQAGQDSFYVGQSTNSLTTNESRKNRFFTHALNSMGVTNFGHQNADFRTNRSAKNLEGIDKIWHDYGFRNCTYYIFNRPGIDTLQESCKLLLNYGFWAGKYSQKENTTFSAGYSANIGEILLVDYFNNNGSSLLPGSTMTNSQAGGQGTKAVSYNPARSKWGTYILEQCGKNTGSAIRKNIKNKNYTVNFTGAGEGKTVSRLSNFLSNPSSDSACLTVTKKFLHDLVAEQFKNLWIKAVKEYASQIVVRGIANINASAASTIEIPEGIRQDIDEAVANFNNQIKSEYINLEFSCNWDQANISIKGISNLRSVLKKQLQDNINSQKPKSLSKVVSEVFKTIFNTEKVVVSCNFGINIKTFSFNKTQEFYSTLESEIQETMSHGESYKSDIEVAITSGVIDAFCYVIYKNRYDRRGILYRDDSKDLEVIRYSMKGNGGDTTYYNWLRSSVASGQIVEANIPTWLSNNRYWDKLYAAAMYTYRKTMGAKFEFRGGKYVFSNINDGIANIPESVTLHKVDDNPVKVSSTNWTYFVGNPRLLGVFQDFETVKELSDLGLF